VKSSRGKTGTHHDTYELPLPNGDVLRTRISRPPDRSEYGSSLWSHILKDQLMVTETEFWGCVNDKQIPDRGTKARPDVDPIPTDVIWALLHRVGISESDIQAMTKEEAISRLTLFWTTGK
jgi:hypothetical protein